MKGPSGLMRNPLRHSSGSVSQTVLLIPAMPALLTRMSILPNAPSVASRVFSTAAGSDTSTLNAVTPDPISFAVFSANGWSRSQIATFAPELTKRSVMARPTPCAPPVTTAQRPSRAILFMARLLYLSSFVIPGCATDLGFTRVRQYDCPSRQQPTWMRRPGIHTPGRGYGFWARSFHSRPGMTVFLLMGERTQIEITSRRPAAVHAMRAAGRERAPLASHIAPAP